MLLKDAEKLDYQKLYTLRATISGDDGVITIPGAIWGFYLPALEEFLPAAETGDPHDKPSGLWYGAVVVAEHPDQLSGNTFGAIYEGEFIEANQLLYKQGLA